MDTQRERDAIHFPDAVFTERPSTPEESERVAAAAMKNAQPGEDPQKFFAIPASDEVQREMDEADRNR